MSKSFIYVALDLENQDKNFQLAKLLTNVNSPDFGFKVNLDSIAHFSKDSLSSYRFIEKLKTLNKKIFIDMKTWNGSRTMKTIANNLKELDVDIMNIYPHVGEKFATQVLESLKDSNTKLFCLSVLTHYDDQYTKWLYQKDLSDTVLMFAEFAKKVGFDGLILPSTKLELVKDFKFLKLCPGIRPEGYKNKSINNQKQINTPKDASLLGADYLVIGSPIHKAENPVLALENIVKSI